MFPMEKYVGEVFANYGVHRIAAALRVHPTLTDCEIFTIELRRPEVERCVEELLSFGPTLVGFSAYLWSFPTLFSVARELKRRAPEMQIVFGGPAAHPRSFDAEPFRDGPEIIDALVTGEGENAVVALVTGSEPESRSLHEIPGLYVSRRFASPLALRDGEGWNATVPGAPIENRSAIASPYQLGLMSRGGLASLQTYYGCPFSCTYCEWGASTDAKRVASTDYLVSELDAYGRLGLDGALLVDAGLNLNRHAFQSLAAAEAEVGFFRERTLICELYPSLLTDEHLGFLDAVGNAQAQIGLQSFDRDTLEALDRRFDERSFERALRELSSVAGVTVEIIFGLPGDNPASFKLTLARLRELSCRVRVYHCVALPRFRERAPSDFRLAYDPYTLKVTSCLGWSETDLRREADALTELSEAEGNLSFGFWWDFDHRSGGRAERSGSPADQRQRTS